MSEESPEIPRIEITKSPEFKVTYASGVFGALRDSEGTMIFFLDRPTPMIEEGDMKMSHVERDLQVEIHLPYKIWVIVYNWMGENIEKVENAREEADS